MSAHGSEPFKGGRGRQRESGRLERGSGRRIGYGSIREGEYLILRKGKNSWDYSSVIWGGRKALPERLFVREGRHKDSYEKRGRDPYGLNLS